MIAWSDTTAAIAPALVQLTGTVRNVGADAKNDHYGSRYATLGAALATVRPALAAAGLGVIQFAHLPDDDGAIAVTTRLVHTSGEWVESTLVVPVGADTAQAIGSATTYARRYALLAMCASAAELDDDDGNATSHSGARAATPGRRPPSATPAQLKMIATVGARKLHLDSQSLAELLTGELGVDLAGAVDNLPKNRVNDALAAIDRLAAEAYTPTTRRVKAEAFEAIAAESRGENDRLSAEAAAYAAEARRVASAAKEAKA